CNGCVSCAARRFLPGNRWIFMVSFLIRRTDPVAYILAKQNGNKAAPSIRVVHHEVPDLSAIRDGPTRRVQEMQTGAFLPDGNSTCLTRKTFPPEMASSKLDHAAHVEYDALERLQAGRQRGEAAGWAWVPGFVQRCIVKVGQIKQRG